MGLVMRHTDGLSAVYPTGSDDTVHDIDWLLLSAVYPTGSQ